MNVVVFGAQWGDEGKGKVVGYFSQFFDVVARFQGGSNAGHTLISGGKKYKFSALPCGIINENITCIIGSGVVLDLGVLVSEIDNLQQEMNVSNLLIADNLSLVLPIHKELDSFFESVRNNKIGTTRRGVGLCYEDRVGRRAVRLDDIINSSWLQSLDELEFRCKPFLGNNLFASKKAESMDEIERCMPKLQNFIVNPSYIFDICNASKTLFEGSQGFWLDVYHGTYPYVTSSSTIPAQACSGTPTTPQNLGISIGVAKAYATRVGNGFMVTEQKNAIGEKIAALGKEVGTVTGRGRRCGWFDAVMVKQALKLSGASGLILTKLDVLDTFDSIKICKAYQLNGDLINYYPSSHIEQEKLIPVYDDLPGWQEVTYGMTKAELLPYNARHYVDKIAELVGVPVVMLSTTPVSEDMLILDREFFNKIVT